MTIATIPIVIANTLIKLLIMDSLIFCPLSMSSLDVFISATNIQ